MTSNVEAVPGIDTVAREMKGPVPSARRVVDPMGPFLREGVSFTEQMDPFLGEGVSFVDQMTESIR
ncbi:MAG TPA: hypothetical protein VFF73_39670 [Planctomycetota bacterium]|nr:hypothetical protein [Planctomycetota bacterium]